ncbi:phospholipase C [Paraburkholderia caballeronis]|uniref:Phospholipase C n=1 Tax=Paraburkholderia caballeronis TaxID=416943 RepID=A0A1H7MYH5_9BURK|nr:alkaline phosphatase family protein [Paraburkholderia caballeronis]PXW26375.1 phospholipase C [Paraburkholderia caballeronis]PXX01922.1 phospholipase C [Paraburkholderia caballeronis]RAK01079.1 phospholipase C [Paraburkholderia caballeronis]SEB99164.1 phospholipase C [Paraburkholderia caballeronis]SEL15697.1 phospholipase C [Paraburkholderia caballeronis]
MFRKSLLPIPFAAALLALSACGSSHDDTPAAPAQSAQDSLKTATPIKHVVVIYGENVSFDHYFATYPTASNLAGEPQFSAAANTQTDINTLVAKSLTGANNPNAAAGSPNLVNATINTITTEPPKAPNGGVALSATVTPQPFRLDRAQANTESQNHSYTPEQLGDDNGKMDATPLFTSAANAIPGSTGEFASPAQVLGYFDGNTVTAYWNYAQNFAMSDNAWTDTFGPSTPGAVEVVSAQNNGAQVSPNVVTNSTTTTNAIVDGQGGMSLIGDLDPTTDTCSIAAEKATSSPQSGPTAMMSSKNIGDLLNAAKITWGGFMGGFNLQTVNDNGTTGCARSTWSDVLGKAVPDYVQHHAWFQYYTSTANPTHQRPSSASVIGSDDPQFDSTATPVHHQYDTDDFFTAVAAGNFPSVSFLKAPAVGDGHPGNSDPLDEQAFVVKVVNFLQQQPDWKNTAVIIAYDDSDGWYDHQKPTIQHSSFDTTLKVTAGNSGNGATFQGADQFTAAGQCTDSGAQQPAGVNGGAVNGRCGPGTRTPFLLISPWAKKNFVDHTTITQASVVRFIEDNWLGGTRLGQGAFDATAGDIRAMLNTTGDTPTVFLDQNLGTKLASAPSN